MKQALDGGAKSVLFTQLVAWLSKELVDMCGVEAQVHPIGSEDDAASFMMELNSLLKELVKF